ncbi:hypothetical protein PAXINDRAFT_20949 [Paxillus involutus ATCC 200175]|uniref:Uncharacterized protein n=1 Tax=Paxillus involutus ATCC 200175 TaxID=664439 RepID=A0A0C9SU11_PAXIN|nr:hypothetical protein PAXINDRAFT_20949 [Paxillus involutus ATCC 200175]
MTTHATASDVSGSYTYSQLIMLGIFLALLMVSLRALGKFVLYFLGFRQGVVKRGSLASRYQSKNYGGHVPRDSHFARLQAHSAEDQGRPLFTIIRSGTLLAGAVYVLGRTWGWWG